MKTVLLVDDSRTVRRVARRLLEGLGFQVEEVDDGQPGLDFCRNSMPAGILLDWNMPQMNGLVFLTALRSMVGGDKPAVIFCTTETEVQFVQAALLAGANDYMFKPFDGSVLRDKVDAVGLL